MNVKFDKPDCLVRNTAVQSENRIVSEWNKLPEEVVTAENIASIGQINRGRDKGN